MRDFDTFAKLAGLAFLALAASAADVNVTGEISDPQGKPVAAASVSARSDGKSTISPVVSDGEGRFTFLSLKAGTWQFRASAPGFEDAVKTFSVTVDGAAVIDLHFERVAARTDALTVSASAPQPDIEHPDPSRRVLARDELLDANPGRPGAPISIPGLPIETASGGIKAPQYFSPGVAGDHGEPVAQFLRVGSYQAPNNLSTNAHGNGYSDPNIIVPAMIESVETDGGAFDVREGNHSVDLAATYVIRPNPAPFANVAADQHDFDLSTGWRWVGVQTSFGNGFLDAPEHRRQYKVNAVNSWNVGAHRLTFLFIGYYGEAKIPGLVPIGVAGLHDTIDPRQRDQTHTGEIALNDVWKQGKDSELQLSGFFRTYNLALYSNFGDGLIRQSEFRTEAGGNSTWVHRVNGHLSFMAGLDYLREAPRRDDLDHYDSGDTLQRVTANNVTLSFLTPFVAVDGNIRRWLHYNLGWRRDQIGFNNVDLPVAANSFNRWVGMNSPKASLSLLPPVLSTLPSVSLSFGETFFTNDPRIGTGTQLGSLVSRAHSYQMVMSKTLLKTDLRVVLGHVTQSGSLARIDPDTGLQYDEGPGVNRYLTASARRYFGRGMLQASVSKADARDLSNGGPIPEAPRLIVDVLGSVERLPFGLGAQAEFEEVGRKPLGDGFAGVPVREFRGAVTRSFDRGRIQAGVHFQLANGYSGQTTEVLALPGEADASERVVGVYIPSYATVSVGYRFGR